MTGYAQLVCGWALVNLESSGAGVGVVARSGNWPAALGSTVRELGQLVSPVENAPGFVLEFTLARGIAVAGLKTPSEVRPGTCVTHLVAGERGAFDGGVALRLFESGALVTSLQDGVSPTEHWPAAAAEPDETLFEGAAAASQEQPWLPVLVGAVLALLAGQGPPIALHVEQVRDSVTMLKALYGVLPRHLLRELTFSTGPEYSPEAPAISTVVGWDTPLPAGRHAINPDSYVEADAETYPRLGRDIVAHRRAGLAVPATLRSVHDVRQWCYQQHLRTVEPALLDDGQLVRVITDPTLGPDWFIEQAVARRAVTLAIDNPEVAAALAAIDHHTVVLNTFEKTLTDYVLADARGHARATRVAEQLGFDISAVVVESSFRRLENGSLSASDAKVVWPQLKKDWATGETEERNRILDQVRRHRALREHAIASPDRFLVYETIRAEISDPAVHTGSSQLLRSAMHSHLAIVAQLLVNVSCNSRDRYVLEQILACAPDDQLPRLVAECAKYQAVDAFELMKAVTLVKAEPEELVAALKPAWRRLRGCLGLPEALEAVTTLDASPATPAATANRFGLRLNVFNRNRTDGLWSKAEVAGILRAAVDDRLVIEEHFEILNAAIAADIDYVAGCMAERSQSTSGAAILAQVLTCAPHDRLPALVTACARHENINPHALMRATCALDLDSPALVDLLTPAWPHLRRHLNLPHRVADILTLDPAAAHPPRLQPLPTPPKPRRKRFSF
ncbi:GAP1-M domain-containing protein [Nocardia sp. NPDC055321]